MSDFNFGTSEENIQDSSGAPQILYPALGKAKLVNVEKRTIKNKQNEEFPNVLAFTFKFEKGEQDEAGNDIGGNIVEKLEWAPREDDDQTKVRNKTGRIGYIMSKVMPKQDAIIDGSQIKSWEHFVDTVLKRFEKNANYKEKLLKIKVPANKYNGKIDFGIPNYNGFIQTPESENKVAFSRKEEQANREYIASQQMAPDSSPDGNGDSDLGLPAGDADDLF